jgi:hypothetical protein
MMITKTSDVSGLPRAYNLLSSNTLCLVCTNYFFLGCNLLYYTKGSKPRITPLVSILYGGLYVLKGTEGTE